MAEFFLLVEKQYPQAERIFIALDNGGNVVTEPKRTLSQQPVFSLFTFYSSYLWRENVSVNEYSSAVLHVGDGEADDDVLEQPTQAR